MPKPILLVIDSADASAHLTGAGEAACAAACASAGWQLEHRVVADVAVLELALGVQRAALVINPDGLAADVLRVLRDSLAQSTGPVVEVRLDNIFTNDPVDGPLQIPGCDLALVSGMGEAGYALAAQSLTSGATS